jgi:HEPN domain-containing protein
VRMNKVVASYLRVAAEDLAGARVLAQAKNRNAIYLCSQAAEKVIRAVLTTEGKHGGIGHKLDMMVDMVPEENPIKPMLREIESLGDFATTFRYPTAAGTMKRIPKQEEFDRLVECVEQALKEAISRFGVDLGEDGLPAGNVDPIR